MGKNDLRLTADEASEKVTWKYNFMLFEIIREIIPPHSACKLEVVK